MGREGRVGGTVGFAGGTVACAEKEGDGSWDQAPGATCEGPLSSLRGPALCSVAGGKSYGESCGICTVDAL